MSSANLAIPLRDAILATSAITSKLIAYKDSFPVFTRRPTPLDVIDPVIIISSDIAVSNSNDGVLDLRPLVTRDISVYGLNDTSQHYRDVELIAYAIKDLFHRQRSVITVAGWSVVLILATGPIVAPVDDDATVGRLVTLNIQLAKLGL